MKFCGAFVLIICLMLTSKPLTAQIPALAVVESSASEAQVAISARPDGAHTPRENWYWAHIGIELKPPFEHFIPTSVGGSAVFGNNILSLKMSIIQNEAELRPGITDISILYGFIDRGNWSFASCSFGLSYIKGSFYSDPQGLVRSDRTIGIVGEVQVALKAYVPGVGIRLHGNLNSIAPYINMELVAHLGWLP
jgi:hypothetical protein